jgi:hypothetical protein
MGLMDRDWYWNRRAQRNLPEDDYLFPSRTSPDRRRVIFPIAAVALAMFALLVFFFGLNQGWFDGSEFSRDAKLRAEERALYPNGRPAVVPRSHVAPGNLTYDAPPRDEARAMAEVKRDATIEVTIALFALISPIVLFALLIGLFIRQVRRPALAGLMFGVAGGFAGAIAQSLNLTPQQPDGLARMLQVATKVGCFFTLTAIVAAVVTFVRRKPSPAPSVSTGGASPEGAGSAPEPQSTAPASEPGVSR